MFSKVACKYVKGYWRFLLLAGGREGCGLQDPTPRQLWGMRHTYASVIVLKNYRKYSGENE
jgi:hypothetical protein